MNYQLLKWGSIFAFLAVILGAFGAHTLEQLLTADRLESFEVGVRYQFYHALALILLSILFAPMKQSKWIRNAGILFIAGVFLFSGSIYLLSCRTLLGIESWRWLGPITPLGGMCFIIGWAMVFWAAIKAR